MVPEELAYMCRETWNDVLTITEFENDNLVNDNIVTSTSIKQHKNRLKRKVAFVDESEPILADNLDYIAIDDNIQDTYSAIDESSASLFFDKGYEISSDFELLPSSDFNVHKLPIECILDRSFHNPMQRLAREICLKALKKSLLGPLEGLKVLSHFTSFAFLDDGFFVIALTRILFENDIGLDTNRLWPPSGMEIFAFTRSITSELNGRELLVLSKGIETELQFTIDQGKSQDQCRDACGTILY